RLIGRVPLLDPIQRQIKPDVGTEAGVFLKDAIVQKAAVEVIFFPQIGHRRDAPAEVIHGLLKAAAVWKVWIAVAQMPLAKNGRLIAGAGKNVGHRRNTWSYERTASANTCGAAPTGVDAGHQLTAR